MSLDISSIKDVVKDIPEYQKFLTVDELKQSSERLVREYPSVVKLITIGHSRSGDPIQALVIGDSGPAALLFGLPHPNEPIGSMMLEFLSRKLAEDKDLRDSLGFKWILIKCSDPDGARLNEGWFSGPFTPLNYARNFYRPPSFQQVEWTFPISYKKLKFTTPLPETRAIMNVIDSERPVFLYSLHNAGFGGAYYYINKECEPLYGIYRDAAIAQGIPLNLGEPEMPYAKKLSDAVYLAPTLKQTYDYLEQYTDKDPAAVIRHGTGSTDYAQRVVKDVFSLVCEVPYFYDPRIDDTTLSNISRKKAILDSVELSEQMTYFLREQYDKIRPLLTSDSKFKEAIDENLRMFPEYDRAKRKWAETQEELERPATVSEEFDNHVVTRFYRMLSFGMFIRMIDHQLAVTSDPQARDRLEQVKQHVNEELERHNKRLLVDLNYSVIPIKRLVAVQLVAGLATARYLSEGRTPRS